MGEPPAPRPLVLKYLPPLRNIQSNAIGIVDNRPELLRERPFQSFTQTRQHHRYRLEKGHEPGVVGVADINRDVIRNRNFGTFDDVEMLLGLTRIHASD